MIDYAINPHYDPVTGRYDPDYKIRNSRKELELKSDELLDTVPVTYSAANTGSSNAKEEILEVIEKSAVTKAGKNFAKNKKK